jgi:hypothetical protein
MDAEGSIKLLGAILWRVPSLPLAACRDSFPRRFDDRIDGENPVARIERHELAARVCAGCPERHRCPVCAVSGAFEHLLHGLR